MGPDRPPVGGRLDRRQDQGQGPRLRHASGRKISLGLKQLTPHPWDGVDERYPVSERINGKVVSITDYGAFIELEKGVEGLIHISEMSWTRHVKHPSKILSIGEMIEAMVLKVDKEHQKISLGLKQVEPDPWSLIEGKYPIGTRLKGKVRNLTNFGAFVEIEEGIDGLLHISDMSWAKRVRHPSEMLNKGDELEVIVLDISQDKKRISLGMKQLQDNPWDSLAAEFTVDTITEGKITRILDRGAVVELRSDVEGFVPVGQMGINDLKHPEEAFDVGDTLPLQGHQGRSEEQAHRAERGRVSQGREQRGAERVPLSAPDPGAPDRTLRGRRGGFECPGRRGTRSRSRA